MAIGKPEMFDKIERPKRLPDEVAATIINAIDSGQLAPGDRLPTENALAERFGVARTVVREAISLLKYDGVVDSRRGVGAFISEARGRTAFRISPACFEKRKRILELLQLRADVQAGASALAAVKRTQNQLTEIEAAFADLAEANARGPQDAAEQRVSSELLFYRLVTEASANSYYVEVIGMIENNIQSNLKSAFQKNTAASEFTDEVLRQHRAVLEAIRDGQAEAAREATQIRFMNAAEKLAAREDFL